MKRKIIALAGLILMIASLAYAYDDKDFQVWNTDTEELKINKDAKIALEEEFRWGDDADEFYYHHYDAGFFYNLKKYLNVGFGYRHIYELKKGKFKPEIAPYLTAVLSWELSGFKFDDRSRFEYRHFNYQADSWRYRNKFSAKLPWKFTKLEIQPYLADEIFLNLQNKAFSQNRFSSGFGLNLTKNLKAEIYYLLQNTKSGVKWPATNVLGTKLKIAF